MTVEKPSKNEEEYFTLRDQEALKRQRELAVAAEAAAERRLHFMKCPRDGYDLESRSYHSVRIERCPQCGGVWLDVGKLEMIQAHVDHTSLLGRLVNDVLVTLGADRRRAKRG
jgi:uncharacterized protein